MNESLVVLQEKVTQYYQKAECQLKQAELLFEQDGTDAVEGLVYASVNELRYAGNHIISAINEISDSEKSESYKKAIHHCERSIYDTLDVQILFVIHKIDQFINDYRMIVITDVLPDYLNCCETIDNIRNNHRERSDDKEANWSAAETELKEIQEILENFNCAR